MDPTSTQQSSSRRPSLVLMWRGNVLAPHQPTNHAERFKPLFAELERVGIDASALVYFDSEVDAARARLMEADGVMVWINPLQDGLYDRSTVDPLLREVAASGVWVSAHPDTILKMGTKEVLYSTQGLGWGADTDIYRSHDEFALRFPVKLAVAGPRVLKPLRGNDGKGVTKVDLVGAGRVRVQEAFDDGIETLELLLLLQRMKAAFGGGLVDQAFQPNVAAGMVRCYMSLDRVVGFSEQAPRNLSPTAERPSFGMNSAKKMHGAGVEKFAALRASMEGDWVPGLQRILGIETNRLPALWDADFLYRAAGSLEASPHVLCEINVSSVSPFPEAAAPAIAATVRRMLNSR